VFSILLCAIFPLIVGCAQSHDNRKPAPIALGAIYNLTGGQAKLDVPSSRGARLAVEEVQRAGGLLGRPVQLVLEDGETNPAVIREKTAALLKRYPSTSALMGLSDTDMTLAAAPVAAQNKRLFLTSGATSPLLPSQVPTYLFLACFGDNVQAAAGAEWAYQDLSARTAAVLYNSRDSYTRLLQEYFQTSFRELGGEVISVESYTPGAMSQAVRRLRNADLIFFSALPDEAPVGVELLRQAGFQTSILGGDAFDSQGSWDKHPNLDKVYFTTHAYLGADNPNPKVTVFRKAYGAAYPGSEPNAFAALGYDAARLLLEAIARAGSPDPAATLQALAGIHDFEGVTGAINYIGGSRIPLKSVTIIGIEGGRRRLIRQFVPAHTPAP